MADGRVHGRAWQPLRGQPRGVVAAGTHAGSNLSERDCVVALRDTTDRARSRAPDPPGRGRLRKITVVSPAGRGALRAWHGGDGAKGPPGIAATAEPSPCGLHLLRCVHAPG